MSNREFTYGNLKMSGKPKEPEKVQKTEKFCPILLAAGYCNGKEMCSPACALFRDQEKDSGCALAFLTSIMVAPR